MKYTAKLNIGVATVALGVAMLAGPAIAQTTPAAADAKPAEDVIIVTGSAIKQSADQSTLPITFISPKEIAKTGYVSTTDLIQNLPSMQGFVPASNSVNGSGGGATTAAIHGLPSKYTLTLIDGQRAAPVGLGLNAGGGYGVNIEAIPLDAVESVEVLRDGAGALYGADAVAGVVNFKLKKNTTDLTAFVEGALPQHKGGGSWSAGASKGFGSLTKDGYNIFVSYSHDEQSSLAASQRSASSRGGYFPFSSGGQNYFFFTPSSNTAPANITVSGKDASGAAVTKTYNPNYAATGNCGTPFAFPLTTSTGQNCRFNFAASVQDIPSSKRDSGLIKATAALGDGEIYASALLSKFDMVAQYAPPAQPLGVNATNRLPSIWNAYVLPFAAANGITPKSATLGYRAVAAGGRTDDYGQGTYHLALGYDGTIKGFGVHLALVESHVHSTDTAAGGYLDSDMFNAAVSSGAYNPVTGSGNSALNAAVLNSRFSTSDSDVKSVNFNVRHKLFDLPGGESMLAVGGEFDHTTYKTIPSALEQSGSGFSTQPASTDTILGGGGGAVPFGAQRNNWGLFAEWVLPVLSNLQVDAQGRYDSYSRVHSDYVFASEADPVTGLQNQLPAANLGNTFNAATGKLSFRYTPVKQVAFRGAVGTGFRAPALSDIAGPIAYGGSTSGSYACPIPGSAGCIPGSAQYDLLAGANGLSGSAGLKPERSTNWGLGVAVTPVPRLYFNIDYWNVQIRHQIQSGGIAEADGFTHPTQYAGLFVNNYIDPVGGFTTIAFEQLPFNGGVAKYAGVDWDIGYATDLNFGHLNLNWSGTWTLTQKYSYSDGGDFNTDLGIYGNDQNVTFKVVSRASVTLDTGKFSNTLVAHYKSGYTDQAYTAGQAVIFTNVNGAKGVATDFPGLKVPSTVYLDWQGVYRATKFVSLLVGVRNLGDKAPPLSSQSGGGGNMQGYDGRYYDPLGRTFYGRINVKF